MVRLFTVVFCFLFFTVASAQSPAVIVPQPYQVPMLVPNPAPSSVVKLSAEKKKLYLLEPPDIISIEAIHWVPKDLETFEEGDDKNVFGHHTIGPDGYITLGSYGRVYVQGLTLEECRGAFEFHFSKHFENPKVSVDILAINSKEYHVIYQSKGMEERIVKFPYTGDDTVLDALKNIAVPPNTIDRIWISRPLGISNKPLILPVDWGTTVLGKADSNYQLIPGDRVFVLEDSRPTIPRTKFLPRRAARVAPTILR
jgi:protein involved in polysaccharide export with SLBB domain